MKLKEFQSERYGEMEGTDYIGWGIFISLAVSFVSAIVLIGFIADFIINYAEVV